jgi:2-O-methyltransferase
MKKNLKDRSMYYLRTLLLIGLLFSFCCAADFEPRFEGIFQEYGSCRLDLIAKFLPLNPVIFEAGGHYGYDTVYFAKKWPNAQIISFEANPSSFEKFLAITSEFYNIQGYNLAISNYNGTATLNICRVNEAASSLLESSELMKLYYEGPKVNIPCVVLDDWCKINQVEHIDFMWLDLEGMELQILQSSPEILKKLKVIYTETNFLEFRIGMTQYKELKAFLENAGFKLLAHWYLESYQGDAIFVKNEIFNSVNRL